MSVIRLLFLLRLPIPIYDSVEVPNGNPMNYIYIHHHNNKVTLMNANCQKAVLTAHILYTLKVQPPNAVVDLLPYPTEAKPTAPVGLPDKADDVYADTFLQPKGSYILLKAKDAGDSEGELLGTPSSPVATSATAGLTGGVRELQLLWEGPKPEFNEKVAAMLTNRAGADQSKKGAAKKAGKK